MALNDLSKDNSTFNVRGAVCKDAWSVGGSNRYYCRQKNCFLQKNEFVVAMTCPNNIRPGDMYSKCNAFTGKHQLFKNDKEEHFKDGDYGCNDIWQTDRNNLYQTGIKNLIDTSSSAWKSFKTNELYLYQTAEQRQIQKAPFDGQQYSGGYPDGKKLSPIRNTENNTKAYWQYCSDQNKTWKPASTTIMRQYDRNSTVLVEQLDNVRQVKYCAIQHSPTPPDLFDQYPPTYNNAMLVLNNGLGKAQCEYLIIRADQKCTDFFNLV